MKKLLLAIVFLSAVTSYAKNQKDTQNFKLTFAGRSMEGGKVTLLLTYEPSEDGKIILEKCDNKHYKCDAIRAFLETCNDVSTPREHMAYKANLTTHVIWNMFKVKN